jgi:hypothetical protein
MVDVERKVVLMMETEAAWEPEARESEEWSMEDLRKKYSWWTSGQGRGVI